MCLIKHKCHFTFVSAPPDPCETFQLSNGKVSKFSIEKYKVTCDPGYKLNIPNALNEQCICSNGEVECVAGQKLKCEAGKYNGLFHSSIYLKTSRQTVQKRLYLLIQRKCMTGSSFVTYMEKN